MSDQEAAELLARCDAVVAPYRSVTGSGVLALARRYGTPVIASDLPGLVEQVDDGETGWLFPANDEASLARVLRGSVTREAAAAMREALGRRPVAAGWDGYADAVMALGRGQPTPDTDPDL